MEDYSVECSWRNATDVKTFWLHYSFFWEFSPHCLQNKPAPTATVKTAWAKVQLLTRLFHKRKKGVQAEQVVSGQRGSGSAKRAQEAEASKCQVSTRHAFISSERQWRDLPGLKKALQQTFQQCFGVCRITERCTKVALNTGPRSKGTEQRNLLSFLYSARKRGLVQIVWRTHLGLLKQSQGL